MQRILGIDPGFGRVGWGVIEQSKSGWEHIAHGCIETDTAQTFAVRLVQIRIAVQKLVKDFSPTRAAVEELFFYKNVSTAIDVGQARGVILLTLVEAGLPVDECTPLQIKQALTGNGRAEKSQVQKMVQMCLRLERRSLQDDAADALAAAITAGASLPLREKIKKGIS